MTLGKAAAAAALVACLVSLPALGNRFALDDGAIVERNSAAHELAAATHAFTSPWWPAEHAAGLWRPAVILSFAADWEASGGSPRWLHAANILWHALVSALVVAFLWPLVPWLAALAGGLLFAVHPVHVEAVANVVGRAELMAAAFVLCALLIGRTVRERRARGAPTWADEALLLAAVLLGLFSKENAAVVIALLALDDLVAAERPPLPLRDYAAIAVASVLWFLARRHVENGVSFAQVAPAFFGIDTMGRLATMMPVVLVLVRLLVWPFDLSPDYNPRIVERLTSPTLEGVLGLLVLLALAAAAVLLWRRYRVVSAGLGFLGIAWLPTSNLLFPTGIVISERTLYLPSVGFVMLVAVVFARLLARGSEARTAAIAVLALAVVAFGIRSASRAPVWKDNRALVVASLIEHPESYKLHETAARVFMRQGDAERALREYRIAMELYPGDNYLLTEVGGTEIMVGHAARALEVLRAAERIDGTLSLTHELLANALLRLDSAPAALREAKLAVATGPTRAASARLLAASWLALHQGDSALAVWPAFAARGGRRFERWLYTFSTQAALGHPVEARAAYDSAVADIPNDSLAMIQIGEAHGLLARPAGLR